MAARTHAPLAARRTISPAAASRPPVAKAASRVPAAAAGMPRFAMTRVLAAPAAAAVARSQIMGGTPMPHSPRGTGVSPVDVQPTNQTSEPGAAHAGQAPKSDSPLKAPASAARRTATAKPNLGDRPRIARPESPWEHEASRLSARLRDDSAPKPRAADAPTIGGKPTLAHPGLGPSPPESEGTRSHPLPTALQRQLEAITGFDLSSIRILSGPAVERRAASLQARAFTQHGRIHLGPTASLADATLLTHETAHILQQTLPAASLVRIGLTSAAPETILRQPFSGTPFTDRRIARAQLRNPGALPFWTLPRSLFRTLDWIGDDGLRMRLSLVMLEEVDRSLFSFRLLESWWKIAVQHAEAFATRKKLWDAVAALAGQTDDPSLLAATRSLAANLPDFVGARWNVMKRIIDFTAATAERSARRWESGLASLNRGVADRLDSLGPDIRATFEEFSDKAWVTDALRTALGCPTTVRDADAVVRWVNGLRDQADWSIVDLASRARNLHTAQFDTNNFTRLSAEEPGARALSADLLTAVRILERPDGIIHGRDRLVALLPRIHPRVASLQFALTTPVQSFTYAFNGLGHSLKAWGHAPVLDFLQPEFAWTAQAGERVETWLSQQEPQVLELAKHALGGIDHWCGLVAETATEAGTLDEEVPDYDSGWFAPIKQLYAALSGAKDKIIAKLIQKIPLLKELAESAGNLWQRAQTHFARFKDRIFKEGRILAPLWEFFLNVLGLELPTEFVSDIANRAGSLLGKILRHPFRFLGNLAKGIAHGLHRFGLNIGDHLLNSLLEWLLGEFNLKPPVTAAKIMGAILHEIGLSKQMLCERIAEYLSRKGRRVTAAQVNDKLEKAIKVGVTALRWVKLLYDGKFAELWDEIKHHLVRLWQWVVEKAVSYVMDRMRNALLKWLAGFLDPTGIMAILKTIKAIYDAIRTVIQYAEKMFAIVREVFRAVREIADGQIDRAATWVENAAAKGLTVAVAFFARVVGLDSVVKYFQDLLRQAQKIVVSAMDALIKLTGDVWEWLVEKAEQAKEWWKNRRTFRDSAGETRTLYYDTTGSAAVLTVSTPDARGQATVQATPLTLEKFLDDFKPANKAERDTIGEIRNLAAQIDKIKKDAGGSFSAAKGEEIHVLFNEIVLELGKLGGNVKPPPTTVDWTTKPIDTEDHGKRMTALRLSTDPGGLIGSKPVSTETKLWSAVKGYQGGGDTFYIKGHLLNHHLHGPGIWTNMTPIARTTNSDMERQVEGKVKQAVIGENKVVFYEVDMIYGAHHKTPRTKAEEKLPSKIECSAEELKYQSGNWVPSGVKVVSKTTLQNEIR